MIEINFYVFFSFFQMCFALKNLTPVTLLCVLPTRCVDMNPTRHPSVSAQRGEVDRTVRLRIGVLMLRV